MFAALRSTTRFAAATALLPAVLLSMGIGCRSGSAAKPAPVDWSADWSEPEPPAKTAKKPKRRRDRDQDSVDDPLNDLWRQGYGFNNPNAEKLKNGEPTEPFFKRRKRSPFDDDRDNYRPPDPQYDPLYNENLRGLSGDPW